MFILFALPYQQISQLKLELKLASQIKLYTIKTTNFNAFMTVIINLF